MPSSRLGGNSKFNGIIIEISMKLIRSKTDSYNVLGNYARGIIYGCFAGPVVNDEILIHDSLTFNNYRVILDKNR